MYLDAGECFLFKLQALWCYVYSDSLGERNCVFSEEVSKTQREKYYVDSIIPTFVLVKRHSTNLRRRIWLNQNVPV